MPSDRHPHSIPAPGVYLCQADAAVSCGACCGLYNVAFNDCESLTTLLAARTKRFQTVPREIGPLDKFARWSAEAAGPPPLAAFHHCPFVGLIGEARRRVGCLLHPLGSGNRGVDLRGLSYYGSFTCRTYFCQASRELTGPHQQLLRAVFDHWYPYGLVVTETRLVTDLLGVVEKRLGHPVDPDLLEHWPTARQALADLLSLKIDWPFRRTDDRDRARIHYLFNDGAHGRPNLRLNVIDGAEDRGDIPIFKALVSHFTDPDHYRAARQILDAAIERVVAALADAPRPTHESEPRHATP